MIYKMLQAFNVVHLCEEDSTMTNICKPTTCEHVEPGLPIPGIIISVDTNNLNIFSSASLSDWRPPYPYYSIKTESTADLVPVKFQV